MSHAPTAVPVLVDFTINLTAIVRQEPDAGSYSASIPALPGCHTQGETLDEVRSNLREAAEGWLAVAQRCTRQNEDVVFLVESPPIHHIHDASGVSIVHARQKQHARFLDTLQRGRKLRFHITLEGCYHECESPEW